MPFDTRETLLLDAATEIFAAKGVTATGLDEIAARAGTSKPAIYEHWRSKADLYRAVVDREIQRFVAELFDAWAGTADLDLRDQARRRYGSMQAYAAKYPAGFALLVRARVPPTDDRAADATDQLASVEQLLTGALARYLRWEMAERGVVVDKGADVLATILLTIGLTTVDRALRDPSWNTDAVIDLLAEFTTNALRSLDPALLQRIDEPSDAAPEP